MARYSSNKNNGDSSIDLFSFQDIISCVTGIMLCVTLLLVINLINSELASDPTKQQNIEKIRKKDLDAVKNLQRQLKVLQLEVGQLDKIIDENDIIPDSIKSLTPQEVERRLTEIELEHAEQMKIEKILDKKLNSYQIIDNELSKKLEIASKGEKELNKKLVKSTNMLLKKKKDIGNANIKLEKVYGSPLEIKAEKSSDGKEAILTIVSKKGITLLFSNGDKKDFKPKWGIIDFAQKEFAQYLKTLKNSDVYFYYLIRPSGVNYYDFLRGIMTDFSFKYGAEPIEERKKVIYK
ncbi:hypothetical protein AAEX28_03560 [Lentisphaerota bacterium WC36G]|nr:hypothetical protein LJT99_06435 [Lentisphaerae bacterium WC36]